MSEIFQVFICEGTNWSKYLCVGNDRYIVWKINLKAYILGVSKDSV